MRTSIRCLVAARYQLILENNVQVSQNNEPLNSLLMTTLRTYGDGCGIAHAMDLVGERWGLLVVRELLLGPKRFTDLRAGLTKASPNVLAERLRELERGGIVQRRQLP